MNNFKKSLLLFTAILMAVVSPLLAVSMTVTWEWLLDDADVTAYRYQIDGEDEDGWTVLDADTDELTLTDLDPYTDYTLYLQRTYDGVNWSESASSTAEAIIVEIPEGVETGAEFAEYQAAAAEEAAVEEAVEEAAEEAVAEEAVAEEEPVEEAVEEAVAEEAVAEEEPVAEEPEAVEEEAAEVVAAPVIVAAKKAKVTDNYEFSLLVDLGASTALDIDPVGINDWEALPAQFALGFEFKDIVSNKVIGLGARINAGVDFITDESWTALDDAADYFDVTNYSSMISLDAMLLLNFGGSTNLVNFYLGGGAGISGTPNPSSQFVDLLDLKTFEVTDSVSFTIDWYAAGLVGIRFEIGNVFSIGLEGNYRYYVGADKHYVSADVVLGFTF